MLGLRVKYKFNSYKFYKKYITYVIYLKKTR